MSGAAGGGGGQLLGAPAADDEPAERAEDHHGDDYSKDDGFHNASSISHGVRRTPLVTSSDGQTPPEGSSRVKVLWQEFINARRVPSSIIPHR
ncbi:hypothetical protein GCM10020256_20250 [Streptomyces thermocoprophilus]